MNLRKYEFDVTPFADGEVERISILSPNRAFGFTLAVSQTPDPDNVWRVRLVRENGREIDSGDVIPRQNHSPGGARFQEKLGIPRSYAVELEFFGVCTALQGARVVGRVNAFAEAVMESATPDSVIEARLWSIAGDAGSYSEEDLELDGSKKYGGVTVDLDDPVEVLITDVDRYPELLQS